MARSVSQRATGLLAAAGLLAVALLPPEHVHVIRTADGHLSDVVHRHYESHQPAGKQAILDHDDEDIEWLTASFIKPQSPVQTFPSLQVLGDPAPLPPLEATCKGVVRIDRISVHDPPWVSASGLRAPPILSA